MPTAEINVFNPVMIHFGNGIINMAGEIAKKYSGVALVVTGGESMQKTGALERLLKILKDSGIKTFVYDGITPNPTCDEIDEAAKMAREKGAGLVIGLGGGSPMDSAKATAVAAKGNVPVWEYLKNPAKDALPVITVASTSGSGSEVNRYSVMTNPKTCEKPGFGYECMYPKEAIIDPEITATMPPFVTASTGFDVFVHSLEASAGKAANVFSKAYSLQAFHLLKNNLEKAYNEPENLEARGKMALASAFAGLAINISGVGIIHGLEHPVSGNYPKVAHGAGLAALAAPSLKYNFETCKRNYMLIAKHMGVKRMDKPDDEYALAFIEKIGDMLKAVNLGLRLKDLGIEREKLPKIAKEAFTTMKFAMENNPVTVSEADALKILEASY